MTRPPEDTLRALANAMADFVESDDYALLFPERVEQAADRTLYTAWPRWEQASRKAVAMRLGRVLGVGVARALEMLDAGVPLARDASALDVTAMAKRWSAEGVRLRVEPAFRWRLPGEG